MDFKVRPFVRALDRLDTPDSRLEGSIVDGRYVLVLDGAVFPVPTITVGDDRDGQHAVVTESEAPAHMGLSVRVEVDADEDRPPDAYGCSLSITKPHPDHAALQAANPELNVLMSPDFSVSVFFGPTGRVNGCCSSSTDWSWR